MACTLTNGRALPYKDSVGGIKAVYFFNYGVEITEVAEVVTDIQASGGGAATCFRYDVKGLTGFEETVNVSRDTGTRFYEQVLSITLTKLDTTTRAQLKLMAYGRPQVVVSDFNGNAYLLGNENGMEVTSGTTTSGQGKGDLSGYTLVLTGQERKSANFIGDATASDPFAGTTTLVTVTAGT